MNDKQVKFIMISAMYENGGNTTHRLLDGHPELYVYPFESQPGTKYVQDCLSSLYPLKYRWPIFPNSASLDELYSCIIDEECKVRAKTPYVSKFRDAEFDFSDKERQELFKQLLQDNPLTRPNIVFAFFQATFQAWKNYNRTGSERTYVGYSPIIGIDGEKIIRDYDGEAAVIHVVRNPFSAFADTKKRPVPLSLDHYMLGWNTCQYYAKLFEAKYPDRFLVVRIEDVMESPVETLTKLLGKIGFKGSDSLGKISWGGKELNEVYPWGTIRIPTPETNLATAKELSKDEVEEIYIRTRRWIEEFGYQDIYKQL